VVPHAEFGEAVRGHPEGRGRDLPAPAGALRHAGRHQGEGRRPLPRLGRPRRLPLAEPAPGHGGRPRAEPAATGLLQQIREENTLFVLFKIYLSKLFRPSVSSTRRLLKGQRAHCSCEGFIYQEIRKDACGKCIFGRCMLHSIIILLLL